MSALILNTATVVSNFKATIASLAFSGEIVTENVVADIIEYIADLDSSYGSMLEYVTGTQDLFADHYSESDINLLGDAMAELGESLINQLDYIGAYTGHGILLFYFDRLIGNDVVLVAELPQHCTN